MSTSRYLNWSRPSPGRHPLRKQMSCIESFSSHSGRSLSAHRGTAFFGNDGGGIQPLSNGQPVATLRARPASATVRSSSASSSSSSSSFAASSNAMAKRVNAVGNGKVLAKQLSLDQQSSTARQGPEAGHAWMTTTNAPSVSCGQTVVTRGSDQCSENPKINGIKKRPPGIGVKNDPEPNEHTKKVLKQGKDARINIKIFLGETVQQDSSDTGVSDTESSTNHTEPSPPQRLPQNPQQLLQSIPKMEEVNMHPEGESKPKSTQLSSEGGSSSSASTANNGRNSSLAQRRAQFHASRQHSEATEKRPPLVRAMSAPIRPIDDNSKFLQSKKKIRKKKLLRERDEIGECDEEDANEDASAIKLNTANSKNTIAGPRSRSVIGGACDIETLVSLLSSGGSDSEKEDTVPTENDPSPTTYSTIIGPGFKPRGPMLKKTGKSVSFQESELKPTAGLNRDYYTPGHRKPPLMQPFANRIRRSQQLANSLNAFQLKDIKKSSSEETKSDEDGDHSGADGDSSKEKTKKESNPAASTLPKSSPDATTGQDLVDGQTPKERECYRLFQKMSNMGLSVSYDTILRGMLTPTELRVLQKQRSKMQTQQGSRQNSSETDVNETSDHNNCDGSVLCGPVESGTEKGYEVAIGQVLEEPAVVEQ
ncbi:uncharacterized protein LOC129768927 isoform X2 [Toxorhynchites rutilus septentrionalis]|uniref:uncharacterized protein LOC129768927 isoform X2 n=1 Tax=Toxorhynchites rutilus septentrionalis TaxID=329112 RepID=UPI0024795E2F|nr:uncharacterized protein LOC129768927 isoform X2 [Toxorhynchites rutilus septentrionalis]